jgi:hypothetical protein
MVGRFGRKVGRSGKRSFFLSHIYRFAEEISKKKKKTSWAEQSHTRDFLYVSPLELLHPIIFQ